MPLPFPGMNPYLERPDGPKFITSSLGYWLNFSILRYSPNIEPLLKKINKFLA